MNNQFLHACTYGHCTNGCSNACEVKTHATLEEGHGIQTSFTSAMMLKQRTQQRLVLMVAIYKMVIAKADSAANIIPKIPNLIPNFIYQLS